MSDEATEAPDLGQAAETDDAPDTGQATEAQESFTDFDPAKDIPEDAGKDWFEQKYNELRSGFTQKTQGLAQERQEAQEYREFITAIQNDPAARDAWLQQEFGYEFDEGEPEEFLDPEDELRARLENVEGALTHQQQEEVQAQQSAQATDEIAEGIEALEKSFGNGFEFEGKTLKAISSYAEVHGPQAIPEIGETFKGFVDEWIASKKGGPRRISQGSPARKAIDPTNQEERFKLYDEIAEEAAPSLE